MTRNSVLYFGSQFFECLSLSENGLAQCLGHIAALGSFLNQKKDFVVHITKVRKNLIKPRAGNQSSSLNPRSKPFSPIKCSFLSASDLLMCMPLPKANLRYHNAQQKKLEFACRTHTSKTPSR